MKSPEILKKKKKKNIMDWSDNDGVNYNNLCFDSL